MDLRLLQDGQTAGATAALARQGDFMIGATVVQPSRRAIAGPAGTVTVEPRVMQLLTVLHEARGAVLSRADLLERCWGGVIVGDDAINRAVAELRRAARRAGAAFEVETIPRVGYRLPLTDEAEAPPAAPIASGSRRALLLGALGVSAVAGSAAYLTRDGHHADAQVSELLDSARQLLREELPDKDDQGIGFLKRAIAREPGNAAAWGMLALAWRNVAEHAPPDQTSAAVAESERAYRRALAIDPGETNALSAQALIKPYFGDWPAAERRMLDAVARAPQAIAVINELVTLYQSSGLAALSRQWNARAARLDPLSPVWQFRDALKSWIFGDLARADRVIDRALDLWPRHPGVWNARLMLFAFTGRARAALAMFADEAVKPPNLPPPAVDLWRVSLAALDGGGEGALARARDANLAAAPRSPGFAINAAMILSRLGLIEDAFAVAEGYLARTGPLVGSSWRSPDQMPVNDQRWRRSMFMFIPVTRPLRAHPRFPALCEAMGLTDFWGRKRVQPDYLKLDATVVS